MNQGTESCWQVRLAREDLHRLLAIEGEIRCLIDRPQAPAPQEELDAKSFPQPRAAQQPAAGRALPRDPDGPGSAGRVT
jgi:hypothetical protein